MINRFFALGAVIAIAAVLGLGWLLGVAPLLAQARDADVQRLAVEQSNDAQVATLQQMKLDYERRDELANQIAELQLSIPGEVDSDLILAYLSGIQQGTGAVVANIVVEEAQTYGIPTTTEGATTTEAPTPVAGVENLYTVPVTISFEPGTTVPQIVAFAGSLQIGPRLFSVTAVTRPTGLDVAGSIKAYMFVISAPDETPGSAFGQYDELLSKYVVPPFKPWGPPGTTATPIPTETPDPSGTATPTPTPTSSTGP